MDGSEAMEGLIDDHLWLPAAAAKRAMRRGHVDDDYLDDLVGYGMVGLVLAARSYRADRGASFATYAGWRVRGAILDGMRQMDWLPRAVRDARSACVIPIDGLIDAEDRDGESELPAVMPDVVDRIQERDRARLLRAAIDGLAPREGLVVREHLAGRTLREIGAQLGVTESAASLIRTKAIKRLRERLAA
jgi:RNA polymerase sigma factor for flagellar operon FliA